MQSFKDILKVSASNVVKLLAGVLVAFVLPKIIGVEDYGYYKTFTLYATYVGLFHLGICDGVYLKFGGKNYSDLNKTKFRFYSQAFFLIEALIALLLGVIALVLLQGEWLFICLGLSVYLLCINITGFYQIISQVVCRFGELSLRNVLQSLGITAVVLVLWILAEVCGVRVSYRLFLIAYVGIVGLLAVWYAITYRDITFGLVEWKEAPWRDLAVFAKAGIPLTVANLCSSLILTLDRQFVSVLFDIETYAVYAFAYNMLSLVTTALTAIAMVAYPRLQRMSDSRRRESYTVFRGGVIVLVLCCLAVYFPLAWFVGWYLPDYEGSLPIFRVILPGLAMSSCVTIVMHNYYKTMGENSRFFRQAFSILGLSIVADVLAYLVWRTPIAISLSSVIVIGAWYLMSESFLVKKMEIKRWGDAGILAAGIVAFYIAAELLGLLRGFAAYSCFCIVLVAGKLMMRTHQNRAHCD